MTNFERWNLFMRDIPSPQGFIDFGFYYMISAALQRRVWVGDTQKLFPNQYCILTGRPGIGKGLVIKPVLEILKHHKLEMPNLTKSAAPVAPATKPRNQDEKDVIDADPNVAAAIQAANYVAGKQQLPRGNKAQEAPLVIPIAANATTYEALVQAMSRSVRRINYSEFDPTLGKNTTKIYTYCALAFCLEEISSLFRKKTEDVANFLITAYDCGDYEYDTKTQGTDYVKKCCLNFFGGTTPTFMESTFNDKILTDGFSSRTWFIFESANRFNTLRIPRLTEEQLQAREAIVQHIGKLTKLYGEVQFTDEAFAFLDAWWQEHDKKERPNTSSKLDYYYARKNIHVQKLAMAMHFGESTEMTIGIETCKHALATLAKIEGNMHHALCFEGKNPLAPVSNKIVRFVSKNGPQSTRNLLANFWDDVNQEDLNIVLNHLRSMGRLVLTTVNGVNGKTTGEKRWSIPEGEEKEPQIVMES